VKFAQLPTGTCLTLGPATLSADEIVAFAKAHDPQWFHTDPARAAHGRWNGLIASGWQTCVVAMRLVCDAVLEGSESFGSPGLAYVKWPNPVRPGEKLLLTVDVLEARRATSKPTLGIVRWRWIMRNELSDIVLELEATSLFDLGASAA
jgi:acyl dehydratase